MGRQRVRNYLFFSFINLFIHQQAKTGNENQRFSVFMTLLIKNSAKHWFLLLVFACLHHFIAKSLLIDLFIFYMTELQIHHIRPFDNDPS